MRRNGFSVYTGRLVFQKSLKRFIRFPRTRNGALLSLTMAVDYINIDKVNYPQTRGVTND